MNTQTFHSEGRRRVLMLTAAGLGMSLVPFAAQSDSSSTTSTVAIAKTGPTGKVVVIGGGMAGATAAKYLRLWGGPNLSVTLVEPDAAYTSNIMSNLVLNGSRTVSTLQYTTTKLASSYGVVRKQAALRSIDPLRKTVTLSDQTVLSYDRLVLAPGVEFDDAFGLTQADYDARTPHAWRAGAQTTLLQKQVAAMTNGGTFVMTIPKAPYRCPPGPYERACLVADFLKTKKGSNCKVLVLDHNLTIQAEVDNFTKAFNVIHAGVINYQAGVTGVQIDPNTKGVSYVDQLGVSHSVQAQAVNPIPAHRATGSAGGGWMANAGLNNSTDGRWAKVNVLSYESTAVPGIHVIGDAAQCGMPKAGHVGNQEAKICADAVIRLLSQQQPDPAPVANSACYSPITASAASWLTAVYQYDPATASMKVAANGGVTAGAAPTEAGRISADNMSDMNTWFKTLMGDTFA